MAIRVVTGRGFTLVLVVILTTTTTITTIVGGYGITLEATLALHHL
jgi:hypothetical protein